MKNEIKEILDKLNNKAEHYILYNYEVKLLLDYITNLQEENERLTRSVVSYDETLLKRNNEYEDYKERNKKAIEYIKDSGITFLNLANQRCFCNNNYADKIINILNGDDK